MPIRRRNIMRYYEIVLNSNAETITEKSRIKLKDYSYDSPIAAVNLFMYRNLDNNESFFAYREEGTCLYCSMSFDESRKSFKEFYDEITGILEEKFLISRFHKQPEEITMYRFLDFLLEAKRRDYTPGVMRIIESAKLWLYYFDDCDDRDSLHYDLREMIISEKNNKERGISDKSLKDEIARIEEHANMDGIKGNMNHYVISARSLEAAGEMTEKLVQSLYRANRLSGRRVEFISGIRPDVFKTKNHLEDILENNKGGAVVIDLSARFGHDAVEYSMTSRYIENLLKKYRNQCLFIFTYDMDDPGFSFQILPQLKKYVIPVMIKEGTGNRKDAVNYMKELIGRTDLSEYAGQAGEFMKMFPGDVFTQTDVLNAFEQFESWCLSKNVLHVPFDGSGDFFLDRDENALSAYDKLQNMIGLEIVKKQIDNILTNDLVEKERKKRMGKKYVASSMHMVFGGNPGTAKTTVAKLFAGITKEKGILKSGSFVEKGGMDLCGIGCVESIRDAFTAAKGGVLFIDECYSMKSDIAVTTLIQEMENRRDEVIVILAGYSDRMKDFMEMNEGLRSRIPHWIDFPDYSEDELTEIFETMAAERGFELTEDAVSRVRYILSKARYLDGFGNGRYARNLLERAIENQSSRILPKGNDAGKLTKREMFLLTEEDISEIDEGLRKERTPGSAYKELREMTGLSSVKEIIDKAIASFKMDRILKDRGIPGERSSCHMVFTGNPGTAKTTVARLLAEILRDEKVLPVGNLVEVGRADLVGAVVGATAKLVKQKFREAKGSVLFIDEAYSLCDGLKNGFGDEAINTIVQEMENNREHTIVIFAGYPEPMEKFLERNPGMSSRIAFKVGFDDYDVDELCDITKLMVQKKKLNITDAALEKLRKIYIDVSKCEDFGNGRFVRKMLEEAQMNIALRLKGESAANITTEMLTTIEEKDIPRAEGSGRKSNKPIGFAY